MGLSIPEPPEYSYTANAMLNAYNTIARTRRYEQGVPLALGATEIVAYLNLSEPHCELHVFVECIFALDNKYLDRVHKRLSNQAKKPS